MMNDDVRLDDDDSEQVKITIDEVKHETKLAYLVVIEGDDLWVPKSISSLDVKNFTISVPEWFAEQEGLL